MISSRYRFSLDTHIIQSQVSIPVALGDTARVLCITLTDAGKPVTIADGCIAKLSIKRPTGTYLEAFCIIKKNSIIKYDFSQNTNTAAVEGVHNCEVTLYSPNGKILTSPKFSMVVSKRAVSSDDIELTDDDLKIIDSLVVAEAGRVAAENERVEADAEREEIAKRAEAAADRVKESLNGDRVYIRYSAYPDGEGYVSEWARGLNYIGVAAGLDEPTDKSGYEWSIFAPTVYVGSGEMPDYADIQIDPDTDDIDYAVVQETGDSEVSVMSQKATTEAIEEAKASSAAPLKGSANGAIVRLEDVPQQTQELLVKVERRNLVTYPFIDKTKTLHGVTWTNNGDGTVTLNGTSTNYNRFYLCEFTAEKSGQYTLSGCPSEGAGGRAAVIAYLNGDENNKYLDIGNGVSFDLVVGDFVKVDIGVINQVSTFDNVVFKPQLEYGEKTEFSPPLSCHTVVACGKNLFDASEDIVAFASNVYAGIDISEKAKIFGRKCRLSIKLKPGKSVPSNCYFGFVYNMVNNGKVSYNADWIVTPAGGLVKSEANLSSVWHTEAYVGALNNGGFSSAQNLERALDAFYVQVEVGTVTTEYEPFVEGLKYYTPSDDGNVEGVTSIYPTTVLATNNGAVLNVEYNRDLNKAFSKLESIVNTLLGG